MTEHITTPEPGCTCERVMPPTVADDLDPAAVERAARAVWKHWNPIAPAWGDAREQDRDEARAQARVALTAACAGEGT